MSRKQASSTVPFISKGRAVQVRDGLCLEDFNKFIKARIGRKTACK